MRARQSPDGAEGKKESEPTHVVALVGKQARRAEPLLLQLNGDAAQRESVRRVHEAREAHRDERVGAVHVRQEGKRALDELRVDE